MPNEMTFTFADLVSGYITGFERGKDAFSMRTTDGREYEVKLTATTYAEVVRNLGEAYLDCTGQMREMLTAGRYAYAYGVFFPEGGVNKFEAKHIVFVGRTPDEWRFE